MSENPYLYQLGISEPTDAQAIDLFVELMTGNITDAHNAKKADIATRQESLAQEASDADASFEAALSHINERAEHWKAESNKEPVVCPEPVVCETNTSETVAAPEATADATTETVATETEVAGEVPAANVTDTEVPA